MIIRTAMLVAVSGILLACGPHPFETGGYQHERRPVYVAATPEGRIISRDWLVDEWRLDAQERPRRRAVPWGVPRTDLALRHRNNEGRIWLDVVDIDVGERDQELRIFGDRILSAGPIGARSKLGDGVDLRRVATESIAIDGHAAHLMVLEAGSGDGMARGMIVLIRANYSEERARIRRLVPVLIVAGYANSASDFDAGIPDFRTFLESLELAPSVANAAGDPLPSPASVGDLGDPGTPEHEPEIAP